MKIAFRADGNNEIGWGHVMRSLTIASAARKKGADCFFICADASMQKKIEEKGFRLTILNSDYHDRPGELETLEKLLFEEKPDYIFVDSYYVTNEYFDEIRSHAPIAYLDDVFAFPYSVDYLINYNIYASEKKYRELYGSRKMPEMLLGLRYVPLRDEFRQVSPVFRDEVQNVLISTGGADEVGLVLRMIKELMSSPDLTDHIVYHFIIGSYEPDRAVIYELAQVHPWIILHENVNNMAEIMCQCDAAVSAAGSTLYELCACGVPTVTYILADNQIGGATEFARRGLMLNAGDLRACEFACKAVIESLKELIRDKAKRESLSIAMREGVSSGGAENIVITIEAECS